MLPFIRDGQALIVQRRAIRRGDIILRWMGQDRLVAHRVVRVINKSGQSLLLTQGDALLSPDGWALQQQVLGRVVMAEHNGRHIMLDTGLQRWLGLLWIRLSPVNRWIYRLLRVRA